MNVKLLLKSLLILSLFSSYLAANDEDETQTKCEKKQERCIDKCDDKEDGSDECYDKCNIKFDKCAESE